jgi:hypothetical protein
MQALAHDFAQRIYRLLGSVMISNFEWGDLNLTARSAHTCTGGAYATLPPKPAYRTVRH